MTPEKKPFPGTGWWRPKDTPARLVVSPVVRGPGGLRELLHVGLPLMMASIVGVANLFFDRYFLAKYDLEYHLAASQAASTTWWMVQQFLIGLIMYVSTFIAQYHGAGMLDRIGRSLWHGMYLALAGVVLNLVLYPFWGPFFELVHRPGLLSQLETVYCQILTWGVVFLLLNTAMSSFFAGRGRTAFIMVAGGVIAVSNILLNRWWIFNPPEWLPFIKPGIEGAGWATSVSFAIGTVLYALWIFVPKAHRIYGVTTSMAFDFAHLKRLLRYGSPQGLFAFIEIAGFSFFFLMIGRVSHEALIASGIALTVNMIIWFPMLGMAQGLGILVGRHLGAGNVANAERIAFMGTALNVLVMIPVALAYAFYPDVFIRWFADPAAMAGMEAEVVRLSRIYLVLVAIYCLSDALAVSYSHVIRGAGDTDFSFWWTAISSLGLLVGPCVVLAWWNPPGAASWMWAAVMAYVVLGGVVYLARYRSGRWKSMLVIEKESLPSTDVVPVPDELTPVEG